MLPIKAKLDVHGVGGVTATFASLIGSFVLDHTQHGLEGMGRVVLEPECVLPARVAVQTATQKSSLINAIAIILLSLPCVLGYNVWSWSGFDVFGGAVLDFEDFLVSNLLLPLGSLVYLLFCVSKRGWGWESFTKEANTGKGMKIRKWMRGYITYILPLIILFIFFFGLYDKFFA